MDGLLKIFSCKEFSEDDDVNIQTDNGENKDTKDMINSIINVNTMKKEECFDSYVYLLSQIDYIKQSQYELICDSLVNFISNNPEILVYDWDKDMPLCCEIAEFKVKLIKNLNENEKNEELKNQLINRINKNFGYFLKKITLVVSYTVVSKDKTSKIELNIDEFRDKHGRDFEDIIEDN